jgi:hypothetical protein
MIRLPPIPAVALPLVVVFLPFELERTAFGLSNLQWAFVLAALASTPVLLDRRKTLIRNRLVLAAGLLTLVYWTSALVAPEFRPNAIAGATRLTIGLTLMMMVIAHEQKALLLRVWYGSAIAAALYALAEYAGLVGSTLFRSEDFYVGTTQRLTASFEYPNTAAAFFAISLPLVWLIPSRTSIRLGGGLLLWTTLILTYSRGALLAALLSFAGFWLLEGRLPRWQSIAAIGAIAAAVLGIAWVASPLLITRLTSITSQNPVSARYELEFTGLRQQPGVDDTTAITVINDGALEWAATGPSEVILMSRWYDIERRILLDGYRTETRIAQDVSAGESLTLNASFQTPEQPGDYLLIWDLRTGPDWFSRLRVAPAFLEAEIAPGGERVTDQRDLSHWTPSREDGPGLDAQVSRGLLWQAAVRMLLAHPVLGVGPDNYRLLYGRYLDYPRWDTNIRANSLYLEIAATTGLAGLAAFLILLASIPWRRSPVSIALGIFLLHGLVDVFLMTTPIYFAFWCLAGLTQDHESVAGPPR